MGSIILQSVHVYTLMTIYFVSIQTTFKLKILWQMVVCVTILHEYLSILCAMYCSSAYSASLVGVQLMFYISAIFKLCNCYLCMDDICQNAMLFMEYTVFDFLPGLLSDVNVKYWRMFWRNHSATEMSTCLTNAQVFKVPIFLLMLKSHFLIQQINRVSRCLKPFIPPSFCDVSI